MFLKKTVLKRLMKEAYKHGLRVAATEERYYLCGGYWEMDILKEYMPKEILAAVLELTGWIPETGAVILRPRWCSSCRRRDSAPAIWGTHCHIRYRKRWSLLSSVSLASVGQLVR